MNATLWTLHGTHGTFAWCSLFDGRQETSIIVPSSPGSAENTTSIFFQHAVCVCVFVCLTYLMKTKPVHMLLWLDGEKHGVAVCCSMLAIRMKQCAFTSNMEMLWMRMQRATKSVHLTKRSVKKLRICLGFVFLSLSCILLKTQSTAVHIKIYRQNKCIKCCFAHKVSEGNGDMQRTANIWPSRSSEICVCWHK